jgi:L-amino acid N-acyltransferase YncA
MFTLLIEAMQPDDWPAVRSIYLEGIGSGHATFETEAPSWQDWDASHHQFGRLVAREADRVVGWAALSPVSRRQVYSGVAEVSVYVSDASRGRGVGRALLDKLICESEQNNIWTLQASVFPENAATKRCTTPNVPRSIVDPSASRLWFPRSRAPRTHRETQ